MFHHHRPGLFRARLALTLTELLVVLAILAGMIGLLVPAVQRARSAARASVCQNNLRQLSFAAASHRELTDQFPVPGESWTVTLLQWLEDKALYDQFRNRIPAGAGALRPVIFRCPSQEDAPLDATGTMASHYALATRPGPRGEPLPGSRIWDRPRDFLQQPSVGPWYRGPVRPVDADDQRGPHAGRYQSS